MTGRIAEALLVTGALLLLAALVGCAHAQPSQVAPTCVVTEPPPGPTTDAFRYTDAEVDALQAWAQDVWLRCASMRAEDYPPGPTEIEADDGEDLD